MIKPLLLSIWILFTPDILLGLQAPDPVVAQAKRPASSASAELALIRHRYLLSLLPVDSSAIDFLHTESEKYAAMLQSDGTWPDINYADSSLAVWTTTDHLERVLTMARSARIDRETGHADNVLETDIVIALKRWTDQDYQNRNWWWNEIGVPLLLAEIGNVAEPWTPADELAKMIAIMKRIDGHGGSRTGANLSWRVTIEIARGCLQNDPELVAGAYSRLYDEIKIVGPAEEGIQVDDSFHQHGRQIYGGGYGLDFVIDVGRFISFAWGTSFQIPPDRLDIFIAYLLDGEQWLIRGDVIDYSTVGREITRKGKVAVPEFRPGEPLSPRGPEYSLKDVVSMLAKTPTSRQREFQAFAARLRKESGGHELVGNKQFWCSDFMAHRRVGYYSSVKMMSTRMRNGEFDNLEGSQSQHLSDGVNLLYLTGDEYKDIFPAWTWTRLPGTTAIQGTLDTGEKNPIAATGVTTFDGGVSDGTYGMAAMDLARGKLSAKKAWFFFDTGYVALGAGISLEGDADHDVATDVNQPILSGDVLSSQSKSPLSPGLHTWHSSRPLWIYHNHVGYIFPADQEVSLSAGPRTGKWSDIGAGSSALVAVPVFDLWIDHGRSPHDATYQYTVLPGAFPGTVAGLAGSPDLAVLSNTAELQAVYSRSLRLVEVAFRQSGEVATPIGRIQADHSCLLLVKQRNDGWTITASDPENEPLLLNVTISGKKTSLQLPTDKWAGSSVRTVLR